MIQPVRWFLLMAICVFCCTPPIWAAPAPGALPQVQATVEAVLALLRQPGLEREQRRAQLSALLRRRFDFPVMSQWVLGVNWRRATSDERQRFSSLFADLLEASYLGKIELYTDEQVEYLGERVEGDRAEVDTRIVTGSADIPIRYKLIRKQDQWLVFDVVIEEVSLVRNYRSSYDEIIRKEGFEALLQRLRDKIAELRAAPEAAGR